MAERACELCGAVIARTADPKRKWCSVTCCDRAHRQRVAKAPKIPVESKRCSGCGFVFPAAGFNKDNSQRDGLQRVCRSCHRKRSSESRRKNPEAARESQKRFIEGHPEKLAAHAAVALAVERGDLIRPESCPRCGAGGRIEAHHGDYDKPLDVEWLCSSCHRKRHGEREVLHGTAG